MDPRLGSGEHGIPQGRARGVRGRGRHVPRGEGEKVGHGSSSWGQSEEAAGRAARREKGERVLGPAAQELSGGGARWRRMEEEEEEGEEGEGENFAALTSSLGPPGLRGGSAPLPEEGGPSPARSSPQLRARSIPDNARKSAASMSLAGAASGLCRQPLGVKALAASALRLLVGIVEDKLGANLVAHKVHLRAYQEHDPALESTTTLTPSCVSTTSSNLLTLSV
ncbi:unnamed protein product [Prorocentrum cordatum]|uniref:Uncharacterized protein n=1 Tax=Prorocentrum cordatum TaxID=2364126 RepID=A0ABN9Y4P2_9DINO|nr:unnamed protein product [Polarella glacialis]